jgi:hypothetical protein
MNAWLSREEVAELTAADKPCKRRSVQCSRLAEMGIPFTINYGGRALVEREAVLKYRERVSKQRTIEPNWGALNDTKAA